MHGKTGGCFLFLFYVHVIGMLLSDIEVGNILATPYLLFYNKSKTAWVAIALSCYIAYSRIYLLADTRGQNFDATALLNSV